MICLQKPPSNIVLTVTPPCSRQQDSKSVVLFVCMAQTTVVCKMEMFRDSEVFSFIIVIFLTCPGQPHIHAVVLKARKQNPFQGYFDLLLWIFQRYHAEPVITTVKCRFKPFDEENEPPKENIKLMAEREKK